MGIFLCEICWRQYEPNDEPNSWLALVQQLPHLPSVAQRCSKPWLSHPGNKLCQQEALHPPISTGSRAKSDGEVELARSCGGDGYKRVGEGQRGGGSGPGESGMGEGGHWHFLVPLLSHTPCHMEILRLEPAIQLA